MNAGLQYGSEQVIHYGDWRMAKSEGWDARPNFTPPHCG